MRKATSGRASAARAAILFVVAASLGGLAFTGALASPGFTPSDPEAIQYDGSGDGQGRSCPTPVAVETDDPLLRWRAEPGLEGVARALAAQEGARRPLPAIGPLEEALPGGTTPAAAGPRATASGAEPPTVWLLRDLGCLAAHGVTDVRADWVAGVASHDGNFIALRADGSRGDLESLPAVFRHELAHLALHEATGGNAPRWLHEGYAQYAAGSWDWQQAWRLRFVFLTGRGDELRELSLGFPGDATGAHTAYLLSYTAVQELANLSGPRGLQAVFARLREGATIDEAVRRTFGITLDQFEERWRKRVGERYGILYMLSRATAFWVALTVALLLLGWWRRRRDRKKLDRMREEERREDQMWEALSGGRSSASRFADPEG